MLDFVICILLQFLFSIGIVVIFGMLLGGINKLFHKIAGRAGYKASIATGIVGTPVHELGHLIMCLIFRHRVLEVKLFQPDAKNGVLGYVTHSYNRRSVYQKIGNFFIGIGPIIFGSLVLFLLMMALTPAVFKSFYSSVFTPSGLSVNDGAALWDMLKGVTLSLFNLSNIKSFLWWLYIILGIMIALHMKISPSDIKTSKMGIGFVFLIFVIVNIVLYLIGTAVMYKATSLIIGASMIIICFLLVSLFFALLSLIFAGMIKIISLPFTRRRYQQGRYQQRR